MFELESSNMHRYVSYVSMLLLFLIFQVTTYLLIKHFYLRIFFSFHRNNAGCVPSSSSGWHCAVCTELDAGTYEDSTLCEPEPEPEPESDEPSLRSDEPSLVDSNPADTSSDFSFSDVTYEIMEQCLKQGRPKLINTQGYTYNQHRQRGIVTDWQCTIQPKMNPC